MIIISHGHRDHIGGLEYMKTLTGAKIGMAKEDWDLAVEAGTMAPPDENDFYITDGMEISLGERTLVAAFTPGHTPGTISLLFPVSWNGEDYMASYFGGQGSPRNIPELVQFRSSIDRMSVYNDLLQADVVLSNHTVGDDGLTRIRRMIDDPSVNPYIVGRESLTGYYEMWRACLSADIDQLVFDGESVDLSAVLAE